MATRSRRLRHPRGSRFGYRSNDLRHSPAGGGLLVPLLHQPLLIAFRGILVSELGGDVTYKGFQVFVSFLF